MRKFFLFVSVVFMSTQLFAQAPPTPTISSQTCGQVVLQVASPPTNVIYYWQGMSCGTSMANSNSTYTVTNSGTYYVRYYSTSATSWYDCSNTVVDVPVPPTVPSVIVNGNTLSYTPPSPSQPNVVYYWQGMNCGTSTLNSSSTYTATTSGTYYLRAYNTVGNCWSTGCEDAVVTITDIQQFITKAKLYPNPSNGLINIELENNEKNVELRVIDLFGRTVYHNVFETFQNETINLGQIPQGIYQVLLRNDLINVSQALVIE